MRLPHRGACGTRFAALLTLLGYIGLNLLSSRVLTAQQTTPPALLTTARQIHQLSAEAAARQLPFRLRGVVTAVSPWQHSFFFADKTGAVSVDNDIATGATDEAEVEISGETLPGEFAPVAHGLRVRVLGRGKMPLAPLFTYNELMQGTHDSQWVAVRGVVRSAKVEPQWGTPMLTLTIEMDGALVVARVTHYATGDAARLVDTVVRLRGVCLSKFNEKRQLTGVELDTPAMSDVAIEEAQPPDLYGLPLTPVQSLLQYQPGRVFNRRVQVVGTVTYQNLGSFLYLQEGNNGVLVLTDQKTPVRLGAKIAVVGFAEPGAYSPRLTESVFHVVEAGKPLLPVPIVADQFLHQGRFRVTAPYDAQLVHIEGNLIETSEHINDDVWLLRDGHTHAVASLEHRPGARTPKIENGSRVSVTGVLSVQVDESGQPSLFRILLRDPSDLVVVKSASWWSARHVVPILAIALLLSLATALWGATLRRTVRQQTQMLRESEERFRKQAQHDALTGLVSRAYLHEQLHEAIRTARFSGEKLGLLMVDLDFFKQVNDTLGHHAGDELLRLVAGRLRAAVRKTDTVARMGGDEFVVLLGNLKDFAEAEEIGAKVVASIAAPAEIAGHAMPISASVGVCLYPDGGCDADTLLQNVDTAMYKAKASGRNSFIVYDDNLKGRRQTSRATLSPAHS